MFCLRGVLLAAAVSLTLSTGSAGSAPDSCPSSPDVASTTLRKKLFCDYDLSVVPVNDTTGAVRVAHYLFPEFFVFDEYYNSLEIHGDSNMEWTDRRLTWNSSEYGGLDELVVKTSEIWMPGIELSTPATMYKVPSYQTRTTCRLSSTGEVHCLIPLVFEAHCNPDITRWPLDSHTCTMNVSATVSQISLLADHLDVDMIEWTTDKYWQLVDADCQRGFTMMGDTKWSTLIYTYGFERHSSFLIATLFIPSIVMLTGTLCAFCLDPAGPARLFLIGANTVCHCLFLMNLFWYLPGNGDKTPLIMTFFCDSLVLVGASLLVTVWAAAMAAAPRAPPFWLFNMAAAARDSPARCLLFDSLYAQSEPDKMASSASNKMASSASNKWRLVTTLVDRASLLVSAVILAVLASAYLP